MPSLVSIAEDARFIGQKVQSVLKAIGKPYNDYLFVDFTPGKLAGAAFEFEKEGWLFIYITECTQQPTFNAERKWDIELFKHERIERLEWEEE